MACPYALDEYSCKAEKTDRLAGVAMTDHTTIRDRLEALIGQVAIFTDDTRSRLGWLEHRAMADVPFLNEKVRALEVVEKILAEQADLNDATCERLDILETHRSRWFMFFIIVVGAFTGNIIAGFLP